MIVRSINPENESLLKEFAEHTDAEIEVRLAKADHAFRDDVLSPLEARLPGRVKTLIGMAERLERGVDEFARMLTLEMGKTLAQAKAEVLKCAACCRHYAENGPALLAPEKVKFEQKDIPGTKAEIRFEPMGTLLAVMPWNFPFWQVFRCAAPVLLSGNSLILKHASNVPQSALLIEKIIGDSLREAGEDAGAFATLLISSSRVEKIIGDPRIHGVTLTGSEGAGRKVAAQAGAQLKKTVLELGGSDPFILFSSANLEQALDAAVQARLLSNGQSCIAAKRFIIHSSLYENFRDGMLARFSKLKLGNPLESSTDLGPLATAQIRKDLHALLTDAEKHGAKVLMGGKLPDGKGYFYPPTVVSDIPKHAKLYTEETFGPLASLYSFENLEEALEIANATPFGLGASVWTSDAAEMELCTRWVQSGQLFINTITASDPRVPFGGTKSSGYGRELGTYGIREWVNVKTVVTYPPKSRPA
ncbi:MAG: NAD-dependent succinate-semialdehyde dehydrogenase [Cryobacterium sp.]|nr:NAD-dependent succinate-semialdehyde dehydrogenase [Oligoflexia bacterium]